MGTLVNDVVMLGLTWAKTFSIRREALSLRMDVPLSTLLLRDGKFFMELFLFIEHSLTLARYTTFHVRYDYLFVFPLV